ncbi:hypothetical protein FSP39_018095, partial [Pinctada imbricata]
SLFFQKETPGQFLFDEVCKKLQLVEKDYFGLRYVDSSKEKQRHWLDPLKAVYKQLKGINPCVLCFRVKFYPSDPMKLHEEITRYYLFLQLRRDLHHGRLLCSPADANLLAAYVIQSEVGDYDEQDHPPGYVSEFKMLPKQNAKMEEEIAKLHKTLSGQVPSEAEANFLKKAATLDTYGVDPHVVWKLQPIGYKCDNVAACKYLWKCAVEQQLFFTLSDSSHHPKLRSGSHWFSRGSKFRFSGRCQNEAFQASEDIHRPEPDFNRTSSLPNYGRKSDSKTSLKNKSMTLDVANVSIKEESPVDVPGGKTNTVAVAELSPTGPIVKAPMAKPEETAIEEDIKPQETIATEVAPKLNGGIPSVVVEGPDELPPYEPNQTVTEEPQGRGDEDTSVNKEESEEEEEEESRKSRPSLEDQIKDLEEQMERKLIFTESNHVDRKDESPETITPQTTNHVQGTPVTENDTKPQTDVPEPTKPRGASCCKIFIMTFFVIFLTLTVTALVIMNSNSKHEAVVKIQEHLQFVNPVRDFISDKVNLIMSKI